MFFVCFYVFICFFQHTDFICFLLFFFFSFFCFFVFFLFFSVNIVILGKKILFTFRRCRVVPASCIHRTADWILDFLITFFWAPRYWYLFFGYFLACYFWSVSILHYWYSSTSTGRWRHRPQSHTPAHLLPLHTRARPRFVTKSMLHVPVFTHMST